MLGTYRRHPSSTLHCLARVAAALASLASQKPSLEHYTKCTKSDKSCLDKSDTLHIAPCARPWCRQISGFLFFFLLLFSCVC